MKQRTRIYLQTKGFRKLVKSHDAIKGYKPNYKIKKMRFMALRGIISNIPKDLKELGNLTCLNDDK